MPKTPAGNTVAAVSDAVGESSTLQATTTAPATSASVQCRTRGKTVQTTITTSAGNGSCVVVIEVSNDDVGYVTAGTITHSAVASGTADGFFIAAPWKYIRARCTSIAGTGATATTTLGQ